jgi:hypothetical protein
MLDDFSQTHLVTLVRSNHLLSPAETNKKTRIVIRKLFKQLLRATATQTPSPEKNKRAGLPDFYLINIPKRGKTYQMAVIYSKWPYVEYNNFFFIPRPTRIYPNLDFLVFQTYDLAALQRGAFRVMIM